ncbi:MAG: hypothetical protein COB53_09760 [Elusimicrobia bacterium]|nr:MAG: hypothetical protein COB53_09760 [Elusimicrobiota bacterium]
MSLRLRISLVILGLMALAQAMFGSAYFILQRRAELADTYNRSMETLRLAAAVCHESSLTDDWTKANSHLSFLREDPTVRYASCTDTKEPIPSGVREFSRYFELKDGSRSRARIGYNNAAVNAAVHSRLRGAIWDMASIASITLFFGLLVALFVARTLTRPIEALAKGARAVGEGDLEYRVPADGREDELETLRARFNAMAERLAETDRMKRNFIQNFTHDLKNPLSGIKACIETLHSGNSGPINGKQRKYLESSLAASERLWDYLDDMLSVMKLQTGRFPMDVQSVETARLLKEAIEGFSIRAENSLITLKVDLSPNLPSVKADEQLLRRVLDNLIANALNFTPREGTITLSAHLRDGQVRVDVHDTGPGIPKDELEEIFENFYQVERNKSRGRTPGTGLGLAVCRSIVAEHGGRIWAESPADGGTRFRFTLPVVYSGNA